jgi:hypothetical protein
MFVMHGSTPVIEATPVVTGHGPSGSSAGGHPVLARFDEALASPVSSLTVHQIREQIRLARSVRAVVDARLIELSRLLTDRATTPGDAWAVDPQRELRTHGGLRPRDLRSLEVQRSGIDAAPQLAPLLAAGVTTGGHVEALGRALSVAGDGCDTLLGHLDSITHRAATMAVDDFDRYVHRLARDAQPDEGLSRFEQQRRSTQMRMWSDRDGMLRCSAAFDPERGAAIAGRLQQQIEAMFHRGDRDIPVEAGPGVDPNDHRRALALHALIVRTGTVRAGTGTAPDDAADRPARAEVIVHIDHQTLVDGVHRHGVSRTSHGADIPPDTARRLACGADIIPLVLSGGSVPLDVGRAKRLATVHQRRALEAVHQTCAVEGCATPFAHCTIHHLQPWEAGGATDLANLVPLCTRHHHAAHEGRWTLALDPVTRRLRAAPPGQRPDDERGPP